MHPANFGIQLNIICGLQEVKKLKIHIQKGYYQKVSSVVFQRAKLKVQSDFQSTKFPALGPRKGQELTFLMWEINKYVDHSDQQSDHSL